MQSRDSFFYEFVFYPGIPALMFVALATRLGPAPLWVEALNFFTVYAWFWRSRNG